MKALCISGFLGLPGDWDFAKKIATLESYAPQSFLSDTLSEAGKKINDLAKKNGCDFIFGYSLGGRMAMHALSQNPEQWKGAVIFSAHPGLEDEKEIFDRGQQDLVWAKRFLDLPWDDVMAQWNAQPVFQGSSPLQRDESMFKREELAELLTCFSLGHQDDLRSSMMSVEKPVLFVAGEKDKKFSKLAKELCYLNVDCFEMMLLPETGHRVLNAPPSTQAHLLDRLKSFLEENS